MNEGQQRTYIKYVYLIDGIMKVSFVIDWIKRTIAKFDSEDDLNMAQVILTFYFLLK